jgi:hypothetical protein
MPAATRMPLKTFQIVDRETMIHLQADSRQRLRPQFDELAIDHWGWAD